MRRLREWIVRFGGLFNKQRKDRELDDEIESHLQLHIEDNVRLGMTPDEARRQAMIKLGGTESTKEAYRDQRGLPVLETLWQDIRYGVRMLRKNPGFTAVAVLTLALGIGANLAIFGLLNELLLRPRPVSKPDELWAITPADAAGQPVYANVCRPYFDEIRRHRLPFKGVIGYAGIQPKLRTREGAERIHAELVSGNYFTFLGIVPALGRGFLPEEDSSAGAHSVAVISHAFWQSKFGGATDVIGKTVTLNGRSIEVVGVAPVGF